MSVDQLVLLRDLGQYDQAIENFDIAGMLGQPKVTFTRNEAGLSSLGDWNCAILTIAAPNSAASKGCFKF